MEQATKAHADAEADLATKTQEAQDEAAVTQAAIDALDTSERDAAEEAVGVATDELNTAEDALQADIDQLKADAAQAKADLPAAQAEKAASSETYQGYNTRNNELVVQIREVKAAIAAETDQAKKSDLQAQLDELNAEREPLRLLVTEYKAKTAELQKAVDDLRVVIAAGTDEGIAASETVIAAQNVVAEKTQALDEANSALSAAQADLNEATLSQLGELNDALADQAEAANAVVAAQDGLDAANSELTRAQTAAQIAHQLLADILASSASADTSTPTTADSLTNLGAEVNTGSGSADASALAGLGLVSITIGAAGARTLARRRAKN